MGRAEIVLSRRERLNGDLLGKLAFMGKAASFILCGLPSVRQVAYPQQRQVDQQLGQIELQVYIVAAACRGKAGEDGSRATAASIAHEKTVLSIKYNAFHFALGYVVVDRDGTVG